MLQNSDILSTSFPNITVPIDSNGKQMTVQNRSPTLLSYNMWRLIEDLLSDAEHEKYCEWNYKEAFPIN